LEGKDIALEADVDSSPTAAGDPIATPAGVHEADVEPRKAREHKGFREDGVEALVRDAIAVENDGVAVFEVEIGLGGEGGGEQEQECECAEAHKTIVAGCHNAGWRGRRGRATGNPGSPCSAGLRRWVARRSVLRA